MHGIALALTCSVVSDNVDHKETEHHTQERVMFLDSRRRAGRRHLAIAAAALLLLAVIVAAAAAAGAALAAIAIDAARVNTATAIESQLQACEDPSDHPFSNADGGGFDNAVPRRTFVRRVLLADECDVVTAVPARYVFAVLRDRGRRQPQRRSP